MAESLLSSTTKGKTLAQLQAERLATATPTVVTPVKTTPTVVKTPTSTPTPVVNPKSSFTTPTMTTQTTPSLTASQLVDKVMLERKDLNNYNTESWWQSADIAQRQSAYAQIGQIAGSAQGLADYAKSKGLTNLQNYQWWSTNSNKQAAWDLMNPKTETPAKNWNDIKTPEEMTSYINSSQVDEFMNNMNSENTPPTKNTPSSNTDLTNPSTVNDNMSYYTDMLKSSTPAPTFNAESKLAELNTKYGTNDLESQVTTLDSQIKDLEAAVRMQTVDEQGKPVAMGVISGRISEEQRNAQEKLDFLNRQKSYAVDQLKTQYSVVSQIMNAATLDYNNATTKYNQEYSQNLQTINLMRGIQAEAKTDAEKQQDDARANFQIMANAISSGTMDWTNATADQKMMVAKLEMQSGLPAGTLDNFAKKSSGWEMKTVLPGTDADGHAITTILEYNKATGEYKTNTIQTDYAPSNKNTSSNILSKSERTDEKGNKVLDIVYNDNTVKTISLGSTNTETTQSKEEQAFNKFRVDIIEKLYSSDPMNQIDETTAKRMIKAQYPSMSDANISKFLAL